jgi:DNA-binding MarR family transcriptional regulator
MLARMIEDDAETNLGPPAAACAPPTGWLNEREDRAWRRFLAMQVQLQRVLGKELQQATGLSHADYAVLVHLSEAPEGRLRPFELSGLAEWEKSRLSHHLTRMERRGLVERQECPSDSRGAFVALTDAGRSAIEAAAPLHVEQVRRWFLSAMTSEQLDVLTEIADEVLSGLEPIEAGCASAAASELGAWVAAEPDGEAPPCPASLTVPD